MSQPRFDSKKFAEFKFKAKDKLEHILKGDQVNKTAPKKPSILIKQDQRSTPFKTLLQFIFTIIAAVVIALAVRTFLFQFYLMPSNGMEPTIRPKELLLINKLSYGISNPFWGITDEKRFLWVIKNPLFGKKLGISKDRYLTRLMSDPRRMDVIMLRVGPLKDQQPVDTIKRIIGLPNETIKIRKGTVYINGRKLTEKHLMFLDLSDHGPVKIPYGSYFVLGDNRSSSVDSRSFGVVSGNKLIGLAFKIVWPPNRSGDIN